MKVNSIPKSDIVTDALSDFIVFMQNSSIELYNEAGLQHELAIFLRQHIGEFFKIELERNVDIFFAKRNFVKKEMDILLIDKENSDNKYCIELKLSHGRGAVPKRMYLAFEDVLFLEQLRNSGFAKCFLLFTTHKDTFWTFKSANHFLRQYFHGEKVSFGALYKKDVPDFLKKGDNDCLFPIINKYTASWRDLKLQDNRLWRYFLLEV